MIALFSFLLITIPLGVPPSKFAQYEASIDEERGMFHCFDGSRQIPLKNVNDNYADCEDGSDEPGTGIFSNSTFYCVNTPNTRIEIASWSVNDGLCDCCDGSDEFFNKYIRCPNTCGQLENERKQLIKSIKSKVIKQYRVAKDYRTKAPACSQEFSEKNAHRINAKIEKLEKNKDERL